MNLDGVGVTVFCSSSNTALEHFAEAGTALGRELAARNARLVYGGGSTVHCSAPSVRTSIPPVTTAVPICCG